MQQAVNKFFDLNRRICSSIEDVLPAAFTRHLHTSYRYMVADYLNAAQDLVVADIGSGKECPYLPAIAIPKGHTIIAVDASEAELRQNTRCQLRVVADACGSNLPFAAESVDLITSRSVLEHLRDNQVFFRSCHRVLRPRGCIVHVFPCRFSPFSLINSILPDRLARALLYFLHPAWQHECGFKVYYDNCSYSEIRRLLDSTGYELIHCELRYYQAIYCNFLAPLYLVMLLYDAVAYLSGIRDLSCQMLILARKHDV